MLINPDVSLICHNNIIIVTKMIVLVLVDIWPCLGLMLLGQLWKEGGNDRIQP